MFHFAGQASSGPLMSNVGAHANTMQVHGSSAKCCHCQGPSATERHKAAFRWRASYAEELSVNFQSGFTAMKTQVSSFHPAVVNAKFVAPHAPLAQAARPLAGGSPITVRPAGEPNAPLRCRAQASEPRSERPPHSSPRSAGALACIRNLGFGQSTRGALGAGSKVRPNPSLERTSTGLARDATQVIVTLRGPSRFRPAQLKR